MMLSEKNDLIIGAINNYNWQDIEPWVVSLEKSGYQGHKALLTFNISSDLVKKLTDRDFYIFSTSVDNEGNSVWVSQTPSIMVERFRYLHAILSNFDGFPIRNVMITDVKDVIFQSNPKEIFYKGNIAYYEGSIIYADEGLTYQEEPWSRHNLSHTFPFMEKQLLPELVICAGVFGGPKDLVIDLLSNIIGLCNGLPDVIPGGGGPDQAALNVTLRQKPWWEYGYNTPFIIHCGTTKKAVLAGHGAVGQVFKDNVDKLHFYRDDPVLMDNRLLYHPKLMKLYTIIHQYNRVPEWQHLSEFYRDISEF